MTPTISARMRSILTMAVLAVLLLIGVSWGWSAVTEPFPEGEEIPTCSPIDITRGDQVYLDQVTVSVLNAGGREGLAGRTLNGLVKNGFGEGDLANAPSDAEVDLVEIWTDEPRNPAVRLVASHLGKDVEVVRRDSGAPGVNIVVGDEFTGVTKGRKKIAASQDATICSPPAPPAAG